MPNLKDILSGIPEMPSIYEADDNAYQPSELEEIFNSVAGQDPVKTAQILRTALKLDAHPAAVENDLTGATEALNTPPREYWQWMEQNRPVTTRYLSDPINMSTAKDLVPELEHHENIFSLAGKGFRSGQVNVEQAELGWQQLMDTLFTGKRSLKNEERLRELEEEIGTLQRPGGFAPTYFAGEQVPNMLLMLKKGGPLAALGALIGGGGAALLGQLGPQVATPEETVTIPAGIVGGAKLGAKLGGNIGVAEAGAILEGGSAYRDFINLKDKNGNPIDPRLAAQGALAVGIINAGLEYASAKLLLRTIPGGDKILDVLNKQEIKKLTTEQTAKSIIKEGVKKYLESIIGENITEFAQETVTQLGEESIKSISGQPFQKKQVGELISESAQVFSPTTQSSAIFGLPGLGLHVRQGIKNIKQAQTDTKIYQVIGQIAENSQYRERLPEGWRTLVEMNTAGGKLENIYIDAEPLVSLLQSKVPEGIDPAKFVSEVAQELAITDQLKEAVDTGKPIKISYATWLEKVVKTPLYREMEQHVKFSEDGITLAQAAVEEERINQLIIVEQEQAEEHIRRDEELKKGHDLIYNDIKNKLFIAGKPENIKKRDWPSYVDRAARLFAAHAATEAARRDISVEEWYQNANRPNIIKADFLPANVAPNIREQMNEREREFLDVLTEKNQTIEVIEQEAQDAYNQIFQAQIKRVGESGARIQDSTSSKRDIRESALKQLMEGYLDKTTKIQANLDFVSLSSTLQGIRGLKDKIGGLMAREGFNQDDESIKSDVFFEGEQPPRAKVNILPDKSMVTLFANADASSFLHESAHIFLADMFEWVKTGQANEKYLADWRTVAGWLKIAEGQEKLTVEQQEQFARGFEAYLMEGKAPSEGLKKVFASLRQWLVRIYRDIAGLNVELSDEVRSVMDRMLATEEEILEREAINGYLMATISQDEVTPQTWSRLNELRERAHDLAVESLLKPQLDEFKPGYQDFLSQEKERVRKVIVLDVAELPIFKVMESLKMTFGMQKDVKDLAARYLKNDHGITDEGVAKFEAIAEAFGYTSGDHLARAIGAAPNFKDEVDHRVATHMAQFYELNGSQDIQFEAEKAVRNDQRLEGLALEKAILMELVATSDRKEMEKQFKRQRNTERAKIDAVAARKFAKTTLAGKPYREAMAATSYFTAERNAAVKQSQALAKKDYQNAAKYGTQKLLNHALALEALRVKQETEKHFKFLHRFQTKKRPAIAEPFLNQIDKILYRFKLIDQLSQVAQADEISLHDWIESRKDSKDADIPRKIANESFQKDYHELTLGELRDLVHAIKNIFGIARNDNRLLTDKKRAEIKEVAENMAASILANNKVLYPEDLDPNIDETKNIKLNALKYLADHKKVEFIVRTLDGYQDQGIVWRYVILPVMRALDKEYKLRREAGEKYGEILHKHYGKNLSQLAIKKIHSPEFAHIFTKGLTKENILMMALNWGSELNQKRLIDGYLKNEEIDKEEAGMIIERYNNSAAAREEPLTPYEIIKREKEQRIRARFESLFLRTMERNDWEFVQDVLDMVNSYWPMIVSIERIRKGVAPEKREEKPIETPYGIYPGGYFHIAYDTRISEQAYRHSEQDNLKGLLEATYVVPSTRTGFTQATVEEVLDRPLALNLSVVDRHLADVIHMVSFINAIRDVDRVLNQKTVITAIKQTRGAHEYRQFREWLEAIGYEYRNPLDATEKLLHKARMGAAVVNMGWKITTAFGQLAGVFPVMQRIGAWRTISGMLEFHSKFVAGKAKDDLKFVVERSEMMRNRSENLDRDIKDVSDKLIRENKFDHIHDTYFRLAGIFDLGVTVPSWIQSYNLHIEGQMKSGRTMEEIDQELAVRYADQVIRETQGSGDIINMAHIQRGSELRKILTMFYSYFSVFANQLMESGDRAINRREYGQLISFAIYWWFLPAVVSEFLAGRGPDDDEEYIQWLAATILKYPMGGFVVLRDVVNALGGRFGGFELSPVGDAFQTGINLWNATVQKTVEGKEIDWGKVGWTGFELGGYFTPYPAKQIKITVGNIFDAIIEGEEFYLRDLLFPKPKSRQ